MVCGRNKVWTAISCVGSRFGQRFDSFNPPGLGLPCDRRQLSAPGSIHPQTLIKKKKTTTKETSLSMEMFRWAILEDAFLDEPPSRRIQCFCHPEEVSELRTWESNGPQQVKKQTHTNNTKRHSRALPPPPICTNLLQRLCCRR